MLDISPIVQAVIGLLVAIITTFLIPYIKSKTTEQQQADIMTWIQIAVQAAEQLFPESGKGAYKKKYVLEFLVGKGITIDEATIDTMVEAAVYEIKREYA